MRVSRASTANWWSSQSERNDSLLLGEGADQVSQLGNRSMAFFIASAALSNGC